MLAQYITSFKKLSSNVSAQLSRLRRSYPKRIETDDTTSNSKAFFSTISGSATIHVMDQELILWHYKLVRSLHFELS